MERIIWPWIPCKACPAISTSRCPKTQAAQEIYVLGILEWEVEREEGEPALSQSNGSLDTWSTLERPGKGKAAPWRTKRGSVTQTVSPIRTPHPHFQTQQLGKLAPGSATSASAAGTEGALEELFSPCVSVLGSTSVCLNTAACIMLLCTKAVPSPFGLSLKAWLLQTNGYQGLPALV